MVNKQVLSSFLVLVILTSSMYMMMPDEVKLSVEKTRSKFFVYENNWEHAMTEYVNLFDGTKKMRAKSRTLINGKDAKNMYFIKRTANFKDNITLINEYYFDADINTVENFPYEHITTCINCQGKILHYEYRDLEYDGITRQAISPESFGHNMKVEWQDGAYYSKVFQQKVASDKLVIRYKPTEPVEKFVVRMFDPLPDTGDTGLIIKMSMRNKTGLIYNNTFAQDQEGNYNATADAIYDSDGGNNNFGGYVFDGATNRFLNFSDVNEMDFTTSDNITICLWANVSKKPTVQNIIQKIDRSTGSGWSFRFAAAPTHFDMEIRNSTSDFCGIDSKSVPLADFNDGNYHHFCVVYNADTGYTYYDGEDETATRTTQCYGDITAENTDMISGYNVQSGGTPNQNFNGTFNNLRLYNIALNATQISNIYNSEILVSDINLSLDGAENNISAELNTKINVTAKSDTGYVCVDIDHPEYGINYLCENQLASFNFNISYFRTTTFNDSTTSKNLSYAGPQNLTVYVRAHQYDVVDRLQINLTSYTHNATLPRDVNIYVNTTLSNSWTGLLQETSQAMDQFNDTSTIKTFNYNTSNVYTDYFRLPKAANVSNATLTVAGRRRYEPIGNEYFVTLVATSVTCSAFEVNGVDCNLLSNGIWKINKSADTYEDNRADVLNTMFMGTYPDTNQDPPFYPIVSNVSGLIGIQTPDFGDVGLKGYYASVEVTSCAITGAGDQSAYINISYGADTLKASSWSQLAARQISGSGTSSGNWSIPTNTTINTVADGANNVWVFSLEFGNDTSADEVTNILDSRLRADSTEASDDIANAISRVFIMTNSTVEFNNVTTTNACTPDLPSFTKKDFNTEHDIPALTTLLPTDSWIEVGVNDGTREWSNAARFNTSTTLDQFFTEITSFLSDCTADDDGFCNVPIIVQSGSAGTLNLTDVEINYSTSYNPFTINRELIETFLNNSNGFTNIPIKIENAQNGSIIVNDLKYDYAGGNKTYRILAHDTDYTLNSSLNVTFFYSRWDYAFPRNVYYLEFIPPTSKSSNVQPFGQNTGRPILNISTFNYGGAMNLSIHLNETNDCVNLTVSEDSAKGNGTQLVNLTWIDVGQLKTLDTDFGVWFFADYHCNYTEWRQWMPTFSFRGCYYNGTCSEDVT